MFALPANAQWPAGASTSDGGHSTDGSYNVTINADFNYPATCHGIVCNKKEISYDIYESVNGGAWTIIAQTGRIPAASYSLSLNRGNGTYRYKAFVRRHYTLLTGWPTLKEVDRFDSEAWSGETRTTVTRLPGTPGTITYSPTSLTCGNASDFTVRWGAATGAGLYQVIQRQRVSGGNWSAWSTLSSTHTSTSYSRSNLPAGYDYEFAVRARYQLGGYYSGWGPYRYGAGIRKPYCQPGAISGFALSDANPLTTGNYTVSWNAATGTVGSYELQERFNSGNWSTVQNNSQRSKTFSSRARGTYCYRVRARNADASSAYTGAQCATVRYPAPGVSISTDVGSVGSNTYDAGYYGRYKVLWSTSGVATTVELLNDQGSVVPNSDGIAGQEYFDQPDNYTATDARYTYRVRAANADAVTVSDPITVLVRPYPIAGAPGDFRLEGAVSSAGNYSLSWVLPNEFINPAPGVNNFFRLSRDGTLLPSLSPDTTRYSFTGGVYGQTYYHRIQSCANDIDHCSGFTPGGTGLAVYIPYPAPGVPGGIQIATLPDDSGNLSLIWGIADGVRIDNYVLEQRGPGGGSWEEIQTSDSLTADIQVSAGGVYEYRVKACNRDNCSGYTAVIPVEVTIVLPPQAPPAPAAKPAAPDSGASDSVGATAGQFRVDESGAAVYRIPIPTPEGTAGVAPEISLAYSSQNRNGIVGKGWTVTGMSGINRCRQTLSQDALAKPITFSEHDRFCLDGQRLIVDNGFTYGAVGAVYTTEIDSYSRITSHGGTRGHPEYFTVVRKDGSISYYGNTADTRQQGGPTATVTWALSRFEDSAGNGIDYNYINNSDGHLIDTIQYAYGGGNSPNAEIVFDYELNDRSDPIQAYIAGYVFETKKRLAGIEVRNNGTTINRYDFTYLPVGGAANKISKLETVRERAGGVYLTPTDLTWSVPQPGFSANHISSLNLSPKDDRGVFDYRPADINGDGFMDLVWLEWDLDGSDTDHQLKYAVSDGTQLQAAVFSTGATEVTFGEDVGSEAVNMEVIDYNADGRHDVIVYNKRSGRWRVFLSKPQAGGGWRLSASPLATPVTTEDAKFVDINSDGLLDVLYVTSAQVRVRYMQPDPSQPLGSDHYYHFGPEVTLTIDYLVGKSNTYLSLKDSQFADFNGDGMTDIYGHYKTVDSSCGLGGGCVFSAYNISVHNGDETFSTYTSNVPAVPKRARIIDLNADGLADIVYGQTDTASEWQYRINNGDGFNAPISLGTLPKDNQVQFTDYNGDGFPDLIWHDPVAKKMYVRTWNHTGFNLALPWRNTSGNAKDAHQFVDFTGDGLPDYIYVTRNYLFNFPGNNPADQPLNVITRIDNGLGQNTNITYKSLTDSNHYNNIDVSTREQCSNRPVVFFNAQQPREIVNYCFTSFSLFYEHLNGGWELPAGNHSFGKTNPVTGTYQPTLEWRAPVYVVTRVSSSAPAAGDLPGINASAANNVSYYYGEAKIQAGGRGFLGFHKVKSRDEQTGVETTTTYRQDFPFIGYPLSTEVRTATGAILSRTDNIWKLQGWNGTGAPPAGPYQPYVAESKEITYQTSTNESNSDNLDVSATALQTVTTTSSYDSHGNPETITAVTTGNGETFTKTSVNQYGTGQSLNLHGTSFSYAELGRLTRAEVTARRDGLAAKTRVSVFNYYSSGAHSGLLATEIVEPDRPTLALTTTYERDQFGNTIKTSQGGQGVTTRVSESVYDSIGRYIDVTKNGYGQVTRQVLARNARGQATLTRDVNGVTASVDYGAFGRTVQEYTSTGGWSRTLWSYCDGSCPASGHYKITTTRAGGGTSYVINDQLGREIRTAVRTFDGSWSYQDTEYDHLGRVKRTSEPHSGVARYWTEMKYDILGRVIRTDLPGVNGDVTVAYSGYITTTTNPLGHVNTQTHNALGEPIQVADHDNGRVTHTYDVEGNLETSTSHGTPADPRTVVITMSYDHLGRKIAMSDPDKGDWHYTYNVFGELLTETDAKSQISTMDYDILGRMVSRVDRRADGSVESNATWQYNNALSGFGLAALELVQDSTSGYIKQLYYDNFGRIDETATNLGGDGDDNHYEKATYDQYGRDFQLYDAGGNGDWRNSAIENRYNARGYLHQVVDANSINGQQTPYYTVVSMDLRGNVTESLGGNGVTSRNSYDAATGRLLALSSELAPGLGDIQDHTYSWDDINNLVDRYDYSGGKNLHEHFDYDNLNRLVSAQVTGRAAQTLQYDGLGNITFKSDVGDYRYGSQCSNGFGPRAVCETSDGVTYQYDANGNMTSDGNGRTLAYTTFDKPYRIDKGSHSTTFKYGPQRTRYLRTDTGAGGTTTTRYIGDVEKTTKPDGTREIRRYLPGNVLITVSRDALGAETGENTHYLYKDHLGSIDTITDRAGTVLQTMSFDAWGQRRAAQDWHALTAAELVSFDHSITTHGFTGHEMLDEVGLVHMNGRVYDPRLGRFLQADPLIQDPASTQSYNRYAYAMNNPLKYTDPSGYFFKKLFKNKVFQFVAVAVISVATYGAASSWAASALVGTNVGSSIAASTLITGAAGGAAAGFAAGVSMAAFNGASLGDSIQAGFKGALTGAVAGGLGNYAATVSPSLGARLASGAINGRLMGGDGKGALRGALAAFIPVDLGMTKLFKTNQFANFFINHFSDYLKGYVIDGTRGGKNNLYGGILNRTVGHSVGLYSSRGASPEFREGVYVYEDRRNNFLNGEAITLGNVVTGHPQSLADPRTFSHELGHFYNQSNLGANYLPVHGLSMGLGLITRSRYGVANNPFFFMEQYPFKDIPYSELLH
ncbi:FG-GAP-like repeat-containing protein [Exilibacterium tricleocarpae]|uniref:FG-GAP-like repeat-containing protein n=1 Tax=Exilibacterium tricleocarpae TaxID=2591008 RepID=UPI0015D27594|nr:FG-GAP-like repeat-containing protein [Exilibacterium tricleocarpae]